MMWMLSASSWRRWLSRNSSARSGDVSTAFIGAADVALIRSEFAGLSNHWNSLVLISCALRSPAPHREKSTRSSRVSDRESYASQPHSKDAGLECRPVRVSGGRTPPAGSRSSNSLTHTQRSRCTHSGRKKADTPDPGRNRCGSHIDHGRHHTLVCPEPRRKCRSDFAVRSSFRARSPHLSCTLRGRTFRRPRRRYCTSRPSRVRSRRPCGTGFGMPLGMAREGNSRGASLRSRCPTCSCRRAWRPGRPPLRQRRH